MSVEIFCCYARKDQQLLSELRAHLMSLQRPGLITLWADTDIEAGSEWEKEIDKHLNSAQIILLLVSADFMVSEFAYGFEMTRAMERHERGEARVVPIILRSVYWQEAPFGKLQALPTHAKPVTTWSDRDDAFYDVAMGIRQIISRYNQTSDLTVAVSPPIRAVPPLQKAQPFVGMAPLSPKLQHILEGHTEVILGIRWSPEGRLLASTGSDKTIRLWNTETEEEISVLTGHSSGVNQVAWSPEGDIFVSCSNDHSMRIWTATGDLLRQIEHAHLDDIRSIDWSPDGQILVSASLDTALKLWLIDDNYEFQFLRVLEGHQGGVQYVAWSPDGTKLASCSDDTTIRIWDPVSWRTRRILRGHTKGIICIAWSPDNNTLASASHDTTVRIWDTRSGKQIQSFTGPQIYVRSVSFSCDGSLLASHSPETRPQRGKPSEGKVRIRRTDTWEEVAIIPELVAWWWVPGLAFHPNNPNILATLGNYDSDVHIWTLK